MSMLLSISHFVQQLFLSLAKIRRQHNVIRNDEVTHRTVATVIALATQPYLRTVLRFRLYLQLNLMTTRELQDYLAAEQRRVKVDVYVGVHLARILSCRTACAAMCATCFCAEQVLEEA
mgnify:CR=1 FL=1